MSFDRHTFVDLDDDATFTEDVVVGPRFELGSELARGGLGRVMTATDRRLERPVAVKMLLRESPASRARFELETRVTARLQHPNIVPVYDGGLDDDGQPFLAMRLVPGRSMAEALEETETLAERLSFLHHVIAACNAIAYAHGERIVHRDLKPDNVLVGAFGETVVIDWGVAKDLSLVDEPVEWVAEQDAVTQTYGDRSHSKSLTQIGGVVGTPAYMPPEQAAGRSVDERCDVYALGAVLYRVLGGRDPYDGARDTLAAVIAGPPVDVSTLEPQAPADLLAIIRKAMNRVPPERYRDARELAADLERFETGRFVEAYHYTTAERVRRWIRTNPTLLALASALVLAVSVTIVSLIWANGTVQAQLAATEAARADVAALRKQELENLDALRLEQAGTIQDQDPVRSLQLLGELSDGVRFDGRVRSVAAAAWAAGPTQPMGPTDPVLKMGVAGTLGAFVHANRVVIRDSSFKLITTLDVRAERGIAVSKSRVIGCSSKNELWEWSESVGLVETKQTCDRVKTTPDGLMWFTDAEDVFLRRTEGWERFSVPVIPITGLARPLTWIRSGREHLLWSLERQRAVQRFENRSTQWGVTVDEARNALAIVGQSPALQIIDSAGERSPYEWSDIPWLVAAVWLDEGLLAAGGPEGVVVVVDTMSDEVSRLAVDGGVLGLTRTAAGQVVGWTDTGLVFELSRQEGSIQLIPKAKLPKGASSMKDGWPDLLALSYGRVHRVSMSAGHGAMGGARGRAENIHVAGKGLWITSDRGVFQVSPNPEKVSSHAAGAVGHCHGLDLFGFVDAVVDSDGKTYPMDTAPRWFDCTDVGWMARNQRELLVVDVTTGHSRRHTLELSGVALPTLSKSDAGWYFMDTARGLFRLATPFADLEAQFLFPEPPVVGSYWRGSFWWISNQARLYKDADFQMDLPGAPTYLAVTDDHLVVSGQEGEVWLLRSPSSNLETLEGHRQWVQRLAARPGGRFVASGGWDNDIWLWDLSTTPATGRALQGHDEAVVGLAWSEDGEKLYSVDTVGNVRFWTDSLPDEPEQLREWIHTTNEALSPRVDASKSARP